MTERHYSSTAVTTALSSGIDGSAASMTVDSTTGFPNQFPFTLAVDIDTQSEELVDVTSANGNSLTVTRGVDGTVGLTHESGAVVKHVITGRDLQNSRDHEEASTDVHGVGASSSVVGTETVQTLEGKTIDGGLNTLQNVPQSAVTDLVADQGTQDDRLATNEGNISSVTSDLSNHEAATNAHGVGEVVGRTEAQTITNKTIDGDNNTLQDIPIGSLRRAIFRKQQTGGPFTIPAQTVAFGNSYTELTNIGGFSTSGHSSQFTVPLNGMYQVIFQVGFDARSISSHIRLEFRGSMTSSDSQSGSVLRDVRGGGSDINESHTTRALAFMFPLVTDTIYGFVIANALGTTLDLPSLPQRTFYELNYLGPSS